MYIIMLLYLHLTVYLKNKFHNNQLNIFNNTAKYNI